MEADLVAREEAGIERRGEPVTVGVPLARGRVREISELALEDPAGNTLRPQATALERWSDGSVRWALLDFPVTLEPHASLGLALKCAAKGPLATPGGLSLTETHDLVRVDTGTAVFELSPGPFPFRSVTCGARECLRAAASGLWVIDGAGTRSRAATTNLVVEARGPQRATLFLEGEFEGTARIPLVFFARLSFFAGGASARCAITLRNPRRAAHPRGIWELGDAGSVLFREASLELACPDAARVSFRETSGAPLQHARGAEFSLVQHASGGENWKSRVHAARDGNVHHAHRGYVVSVDSATREGLRASPRVVLHDGQRGISAGVRDFWQNFPKALEAREGTVRVGLFPDVSDALHELSGGEQKTHELVLSFGEEALSARPDALLDPLLVVPTPCAFEAAGAIPWLSPRSTLGPAVYETLVDEAFGPDGFPAKRERADEFGWRHFGEMPADHEAVSWKGPGTFVSHYNNQYDAVFGALHQLARTGDVRWFRLMDELARHVTDIDVYHTDQDRPAYNRGLFWPTVHYVDGGLSTHRSYPRGTSGGGPDNEHNYTTGLRHWWLLTGNPLGREASLDGARRAAAADDGAGTPFRFLVRSPTGYATKTRSLDYHGPGRGAANTLVAFLDAWRTTGEERWMTLCEDVIRRTVHPKDDVAARDLLDAENRWSYTVYLQALGRYLDDCADAGRRGFMYAWARESLMAYARWMAENERPTLEQADRLEYPTETWPAQDLRKAEVLALAALHSAGEERARFAERARWFRDESLAVLGSFATRTLTRPLVLLMRYGPFVTWLETHPAAAMPPPEGAGFDFGQPRPFTPQRTRALRRLRDVVGLAAMTGAGFALARLLGT